ncbi:MAG: L,D-transpeptidase family protein, partial [Hyphomicrobiaceae bacterium]
MLVGSAVAVLMVAVTVAAVMLSSASPSDPGTESWPSAMGHAPDRRATAANIVTGALPPLAPSLATPDQQPGALRGRLAFIPPESSFLPSIQDEPAADPAAPDQELTLKPTLEPESPVLDPWSTNVQSLPTPRPPTPKAKAKAETDTPAIANQSRRRPPPSKPHRRNRSYSLGERLAEISPAATGRLMAYFKSSDVPWPPSEVTLIALKKSRKLELYARSEGAPWKFVHSYRVLAASGRAGPKLQRGDRQVPEGIYRISYLNPNSAYHVSLRVNYPNAFDRRMANVDGRKDLGGDIMIHGKNRSAGCLAMGDTAAEELFVLAAKVKLSNIKVIIAPQDFRENSLPIIPASQPQWQSALYTEIASALANYKKPPSPGLL